MPNRTNLFGLFFDLGGQLGVFRLGPAPGGPDDLLLLSLLLPFVIDPVDRLEHLQLATHL